MPDKVNVRAAIEQIAKPVDPSVRVDELARGDQFFSVVNTLPENYCVVTQPQVAPESDIIEVRLMKAAPGSNRDQVCTTDASQPSVCLHLSAWCNGEVLPQVLSSAVAWGASTAGAGSSRRVAAPANIRPLSLWPEVIRPALADEDAEEVAADALVLVQDSVQERYDIILQQLDTHGPLSLMLMDDARACDLARLVEAHVLDTAEDEFGDTVYSLRAGAVRIHL